MPYIKKHQKKLFTYTNTQKTYAQTQTQIRTTQPSSEKQPATKKQYALRCINKNSMPCAASTKTVCLALPKQTNKRTNKPTKRTNV